MAVKTKKEAPKNSQAPAKKTNGAATVKPKEDAAEGLRELFIDSLKDIYWAEKALTKALPKMMKNASSPELQSAIDEHLKITQEQVLRLENVFSSVEVKPQAKKCEAMEGLIKEAQDIMESTEPGMVRDAGIIAAAQKVEHYEIATYGTLQVFAQLLGEDEAAQLLGETLLEEKEADSKLTEVAMESINVGAMQED